MEQLFLYVHFQHVQSRSEQPPRLSATANLLWVNTHERTQLGVKTAAPAVSEINGYVVTLGAVPVHTIPVRRLV